MNYEPDKKIAEELLSYFNLKRYSELINKITIIQLKFPQSVFLLNILGSTYFELGNNEKAIKSFEKIIKLTLALQMHIIIWELFIKLLVTQINHSIVILNVLI